MEPNPTNLTDNTIPDPAQLTGADGDAAVAETLSLADLNATLGKNFKDKATALAALKETQSFVGRRVEAAQPQATANPALEEQVRSLQEQVFYATNPQLKGHEAVMKQMGSNPAEVVLTEAFKQYMEKATVADEVTKTKSVINSNARIGQSVPSLENAVKAANTGNTEAMMGALTEAILEDLNA